MLPSSQAGRLVPLVIAACLLLAPAASATGARPDPPTSDALERATPRLEPPPRPAQAAPRRLFPETRVVTVYGAPQLGATIVGKRSPAGAAQESARLATRYGEVDALRPAQPGIDLIAVIATADPGPSGLYRTRQSPELIATYLDAARSVGGRLVLDIQPGRSKPIRETKALEDWLLEPDVDLAIDPEWNVGRRGVPGRTQGKISARQVDKVSSHLARLVRLNGLPDKALYVHQFREGSVRGRARVDRRAAVDVTLNFDGIGGPAAKIAGYRNLSQPGLFNGFSIFVSRDSNVIGFRRVASLEPPTDYVMYQ